MRRNLLKPLLTCLLLLGGIVASMGQTTTLISYTNEWRYLITNALPVGGWTNVTYAAEAGWPLGAGPLAFPANEAMPAGVPALRTTLATNFNNNFVTSFYFRASVTLTSNPANVIITANAAIDDGAVFYVNGRRVQNVRMPTTAITHTTLATGDGGADVSGRALDTFTIASSNFVQGANTIAVSIHQSSGTSSDVAFGLELLAQTVLPVTITSQPQDQSVDVGARPTFTVGATGTSLTYQWFSNDVRIAGATAASYQTPATTLAMSGIIYHVVVSNVLGQVQSADARLTVTQDRSGPILLTAEQDGSFSNRLILQFDENLANPDANHTSITNVNNFTVTILETGEQLEVTNVNFAVSRLRLWLDGTIDRATNYIVCAYNMEDTRSNVTASSCIGLSFLISTNLFGFGEAWRFNDKQWLVGNTEPTNASPTVNWKHVNYPDAPGGGLWLEEQAPLREDIDFTGTLCETHSGSSLGRTATTSYMRKRFVVNDDFSQARINIRHQIDDGAVFYLNGTEIYRINMPAGTPSYGTFASSAVEGGCTTVTVSGRGTNFVQGTNVLAVELHQFNEITTPQHDTFFDVELGVSYPKFPIIPMLTIARTGTVANPVVNVRWATNTPGWRLEHATTITGAWSTVTTTTTNYNATVSQQGPRRFYRLANGTNN